MKSITKHTEEINKIKLTSNDDKRTQSIDAVEMYAYGMRNNLVCKKEKIKRINLIKQYKLYELKGHNLK